MKRLLASLAIVTSFGIVEAGTMTVSMDDIVLLSQRGVSDQTILVLLQTREIGFVPGADDIDSLLETGVSEEVIRYLLQKTATPPPDTYIPVSYADPYPSYYYRPYYASTSLYYGYSSFPHTSYRYRHHGAGHHSRPHHPAPRHYRTHNDHDNAGHDIPHTGYDTGSAGHDKTVSISHNARNAGHSRSGSASHSRNSRIGHRSGHSRGHSSGHSGGGHGSGH